MFFSVQGEGGGLGGSHVRTGHVVAGSGLFLGLDRLCFGFRG